MKIKNWLRVTTVEDMLNMRVDNHFYSSDRDDDKIIDYVFVQDNGVVRIHTKGAEE